MANSLSDLPPIFWAREAQRSLFVENKAMAIADTSVRNLLAGEGKTVRKTTVNYPASQTYTPGTDITGTPLASGAEDLTVNTWRTALVTIDDTEDKQSIIDLGRNMMEKMMKQHNNYIEQTVLAEVTNSRFSLDDGNVGGTSGNDMSLNTSNIPQVFIAADTKLDAIDAPKANRTAVVGGHFLGLLKLQQAGRNTIFGDGVNTRGVVTNLFGWNILYSNNLRYTASLDTSTIFVATDTVTIASVVFTACANGAASGAGGFSISTTAALATANLVAAINGTGTPGVTTYIDLSGEDRFLLTQKRGVVATNNTTSISIVGYGDIVVAEAATPAGTVWSSQHQDSLFLVAGQGPSLVIQIPPKTEVLRAQLQWGDIVRSLAGHGVKTYADGAREMVRVKIAANTSDWT